MPLRKMNMFGNQNAVPQQNQGFQIPSAPEQLGIGNYTPMLGRVPISMRGQGGLQLPPGLDRSRNGLIGGLGRVMPRTPGMPVGNPGWGAMPQNAGGHGYAAPGYSPQGFGQPQQPMLPAQGYPSQGFLSQGFGGQMPVQPVQEVPKKGGIKGFISSFMAKRK